MELVYEIGIIKMFKHDNSPFVVISNTLNKESLDVIGCYQGKDGVIKRIRKNSAHGKMILDLCGIQEEPLSQDAIRLRELISNLSCKMDMVK